MMKGHEGKNNADRIEQVAMIIIVTLFVLSLLPVFYVGFHTYPTGDDFWYGKYVARAWQEKHSLAACIMAACAAIKEFYYTWQGTWFSIFLFCFNPEIFVTGGYKIVSILAVGLLGGGFALLMYQLMVRTLKLSREAFWISFCMIMFQVIQYMPRTTSGIYWFNGIMHYNANTFIAMVAISMMAIYLRSGKKYAWLLAVLGMALLGGGNYQAALLPLLVWGLLLLGTLFTVEKGASVKARVANLLHSKRVWLLGIGILLELPGLAVSAKAPGNSMRSEEYELSLKWALKSVIYSIDRGIYLVRDDFYAKYPAMLACLIFLVVLLWFAMWKIKDACSFRFPVPTLFVLYMCGIYWAMYTPGIFSKSDVSGGVPDTIQQIFLLTSLANVVYVIGYVQRFLREHLKEKTLQNAWWGPAGFHKKIRTILLAVSFAAILLLISAGWRDTTDGLCFSYVAEGRMKVYELVRQEQLRILKDSAIEDARLPELYGYNCYPVCHMQIDKDSAFRLNVDEQIYYGKKSVVGYDFREWFEAAGYMELLE